MPTKTNRTRHKLCLLAQTRGGRALIKLMENATGGPYCQRARGYEDDVANGNDLLWCNLRAKPRYRWR